MKKKVLVFVNIIAPYNIPVFNKVSDALDGNVLFLFDQVKEGNRNWEVVDNKINFKYKIKNSWKIKTFSKVGNKAILHRTLYFPFFIFKEIWVNKPEVVLSIEFGLRSIFSLLMCKLTGARLIIISDVTTTTEANVGSMKKIIRKLIARRLDGAIARSYNAKKYLETLGLSNKQITVAPYAIDIPDWENLSPNREIHSFFENLKEQTNKKFCFLYSGHFTRLKGLDILIRVVESLPEQIKNQIIFVLAGGTETDLIEISDSYNRRIFYPIGFIPNEDLFLLYRQADCFLLPTRSDTWALVVNEAIVAGCPVVVSQYAGSAGELIEDRVSGIVFDPLNEVQFADKLIFCLNNKEQLDSYAKKAKDKLVEYNNEVSARRIVVSIQNQA
jgi:glycosyltransferase involved in cell wall biosynthesis